MEEMIKVFKAIGDETRIKILILLSKRNICAKGISKHLQISEAAVSQHIKILKDAELIKGYKEGYYVVYDINKEVFQKAIDFMDIFFLSEDLNLIHNKLNGYINEFSILKCPNNCKRIKKCCKNAIEEE